MKTKNLIIFLVLFLASCSPVKKLERLHKKHPYIFTEITDTLIYTDTIRDTIAGSISDTSFHKSKLKDTVYIENGIVKTIIHEHRDTIFVQNEVDTIFTEKIIEKKLPYPVYLPKEENKFDKMFKVYFIGAIIILVIVWILNTFIKRP